jgi:hypothetical protein
MTNYKRKLNREQYRSTHPLMRFRKNSINMTNFISEELSPGSIVSVDSCPWALKIPCDQIYELKLYQQLFRKKTLVTFLNSIADLPDDKIYDNLLLCGIVEFKYQPWQQVISAVTKIAKISRGKVIVALPITLLFFHRLKHNYHDIINQIKHSFDQLGWHCHRCLLDMDIVYFSLDKK